ncbi:MAG: hypothetical protein EOO18_11390 [Chryseobacterium sp.]|nr:MAG: hypothetical protein EOO18_11390 [Chryseobacterium sp.]
MDQTSNKKKVTIIIVVGIIVVSIVGLSIYGLVGNSTKNEVNTVQNDSPTSQNSQTLQQDVAEINTSIKKEVTDHQAVKDAYADKGRIKLAE